MIKINTCDYGIEHCAFADTGYCPVGTHKGCVEKDGYCWMSIEDFERLCNEKMKETK